MSANKTIHDWLLANKPDEADHDVDTCPFCTEKASEQEEEVSAETIFTQEQHEQLLTSAVDKAVASATSDADAEILRLNERLEAAEKELAERDEKIEDLESKIQAREEQDRLEALAAERVELVQAVASFSDEQIDARKMKWAKMSEEDFTSYLEDIREVAKAPTTEEKVPETEFDGTRETAGDGSEKSAINAFFSPENLTVAAQS